MDYEKLAESVRLCGSTPKVDQCKQCAYWSGGDMSKCIPRMTTDAADALSTLQAEIQKLRAELKQVKTERDAAVEDIAGILAKAELIRREIGYRLDYESDNKLADLCIDYCKNNVCVRCYEEREDGGCNNFLWRGLKED